MNIIASNYHLVLSARKVIIYPIKVLILHMRTKQTCRAEQ